MALQFKDVQIPLAVGVDESVDDRVQPVGKLALCRNGEFTKAGALRKRHGFTALSSIVGAGSPWTKASSLFSTGRELCVAASGSATSGPRNIYSYDQDGSRWTTSRGSCAAFSGKSRTIWRDEFDWYQCDLDVDETQTYALVAGNAHSIFSDRGAPVYYSFIGVYLPDENWEVLHDKTQVVTGTGANLQKMKVGHSTDDRLVAMGYSLTSTKLEGYAFNPSQRTQAPVLIGLPLSDNTVHENKAFRTYDIAPMVGASTDTYVVAYVRAGQTDIDIESKDEGHATVASYTMFGGANHQMETLALHWDPIEPALYLLWVETAIAPDPNPGRARLQLTKIPADFSPSPWTRTLVQFGGGGEDPETPWVHTLGCHRDSQSDTIVCACTYRLLNSGVGERVEYTLTVGADRNDLWQSNVVNSPNLLMLTKPYEHDGNTYITTINDLRASASQVVCYQYVSNEIYELINTGSGQGDMRGERLLPAGVHDVGTGSRVNQWDDDLADVTYGEGAAQNVALLTSGRFAYANHSRSTTYQIGASPWSGAGNPFGGNRREFAMVELSFDDFQMQAAQLQEGQVFCSGAYSTWYDGSSIMESHTPAPAIAMTGAQSILAAVDETTLPQDGTLPDGTYFYWPIWIFRDDTGALHRGIVGPYYTVLVDEASDKDVPELYIRATPWTYRWWPNGLHQVALYRSSATDGIAYRCNPDIISYNTDEYAGFTVHDYGDRTQETLYTFGGALENVCPEGFQWCMTHNERVWTAGHFRRARIQYSKRFTPGTASEVQFSPEFHESMGFVLPEGEECNGIAPLDDKVIIFSDTSIYAVAGVGPDDAGLNSDFSQLTLITDKVGCDDAKSVVSFPGGVMFIGDGIIQMLNRSLEVTPVGQRVRDRIGSVAYAIVSADCLPERYQVFFTFGPSFVLVYDYRLDEWMEWFVSTSGGSPTYKDACVHDGEFYVLTSDAVYKYNTNTWRDDETEFVNMVVRTAWIQSAGPAGWQRVRDIIVNAEYMDSHNLTVSLKHDFSEALGQQSYTWDDTELTSMFEHTYAKREQLKLRVVRQKCQAVQVMIQDTEHLPETPGNSYKLFSLGLRIGSKPGLVRVRHDQLS